MWLFKLLARVDRSRAFLSAVWFKIAESGKTADGKWAATDLLTATDSIYTFTIPPKLQPGQYIIRHEMCVVLTLNSKVLTDGYAQHRPARRFRISRCPVLPGLGSGCRSPASRSESVDLVPHSRPRALCPSQEHTLQIRMYMSFNDNECELTPVVFHAAPESFTMCTPTLALIPSRALRCK